MQSSGQVFNGKLTLVDDMTGLCYRKEQFISEDTLPIEYVVVDRRYSSEGIKKLVKAAGFIIEKCNCVQSGHFDDPLSANDNKAKEILIVAKKGNVFANLMHMIIGSRDISDCWK